MPEPATQTIRKRVTDMCLENLTGDENVTDEFQQGLRKLLEEAKPPKAVAFVDLFEKHSEGKPA